MSELSSGWGGQDGLGRRGSGGNVDAANVEESDVQVARAA